MASSACLCLCVYACVSSVCRCVRGLCLFGVTLLRHGNVCAPGVLLRLLEGFDGSLFITSNRASSFDPAALSRVTLAVRFAPLDAVAKTTLWGHMLTRVIGDAEGMSSAAAMAQVRGEFDLDALGAQFSGSGRAVGAVLRLALGLCGQRRARLSQGVLEDAIKAWSSFHDDLREEGAQHT